MFQSSKPFRELLSGSRVITELVTFFRKCHLFSQPLPTKFTSQIADALGRSVHGADLYNLLQHYFCSQEHVNEAGGMLGSFVLKL
jgi:hypothetical protein